MLDEWCGSSVQNRRLSFQRGTFRLGPHDILDGVSGSAQNVLEMEIDLHTVVIQGYIDIKNVAVFQPALIGYSMANGLVDRSVKMKPVRRGYI